MAKKGTTDPTALTYEQALEESLCHGWIDGQIRRRDEGTYLQRVTPRRSGSIWSQRNVSILERPNAQGRMHESGLAEVARAKDDGRWDAAYAGSATIEVPADLAQALDAEPAAQQMFADLDRQNRYAVLHRIITAKRADTRARRVQKYVDMLSRGETIYPQAKHST